MKVFLMEIKIVFFCFPLFELHKNKQISTNTNVLLRY